ncbi:MAG: ABC transporter substrate-binding protein [Candidatus Dormibacteria bacterium]
MNLLMVLSHGACRLHPGRRVMMLIAITLAVASSACAGLAVPPLGPQPPLSGYVIIDLAGGERDAAHLAIEEANSSDSTLVQLAGIRLKPFDMNDTLDGFLDPGAAAQRLSALLNGPDSARYLAMVGPLNVDIARREMPIASQAQLVMVSPDLTADCLTQYQQYCSQGEPVVLYPRGSVNHQKGVDFFYRLSATESSEGPAAADYARNKLNLASALVVGDGSTSGKVTGSDFAARFTSDGGQVVGTVTLGAEADQTVAAAASAAKQKGAAMVFYGGTDAAFAARLTSALAGTPTVFFGTESLISSPTFVQSAGPAAEGAYAISLQPDVTYSAEATGPCADFLRLWRARYPDRQPTGYELNAFLATTLVTRTISNTAITSSGQAVGLPLPFTLLNAFLGQGNAPPPQPGQLAVTGVSLDAGDNYGFISFDTGAHDNYTGDNLDKVVSIYSVRHGAWIFVNQEQFAI